MSTTVFTDVNAPIGIGADSETVNKQVFGEKLSFLTKLFGCQHRNVSRPFSNGRTGYRACINCGARRQFNPRTLQTFGAFYAPPPAEKAVHF